MAKNGFMMMTAIGGVFNAANHKNNIPFNHFLIPFNFLFLLLILANQNAILLRAEKTGGQASGPVMSSDNDGPDDEESANLPHPKESPPFLFEPIPLSILCTQKSPQNSSKRANSLRFHNAIYNLVEIIQNSDGIINEAAFHLHQQKTMNSAEPEFIDSASGTTTAAAASTSSKCQPQSNVGGGNCQQQRTMAIGMTNKGEDHSQGAQCQQQQRQTAQHSAMASTIGTRQVQQIPTDSQPQSPIKNATIGHSAAGPPSQQPPTILAPSAPNQIPQSSHQNVHPNPQQPPQFHQIRAVPHQPRPLPSTATGPLHSQGWSSSAMDSSLGSAPQSPMVDARQMISAVNAIQGGGSRNPLPSGQNPQRQPASNASRVPSSSSVATASAQLKYSLESPMQPNAKLLAPVEENSGPEEEEEEEGRGEMTRMGGAMGRNGPMPLEEAMGEAERGQQQQQQQPQGEDCAFCRSFDCEIIFALLFNFIIGFILIFILIFWVRGVIQYEDLHRL